MIEDEGTLAIVIVLCGFLLFGTIAVIAYNITYDRKPEVVKCMEACGSILQSGDEARMATLELKRDCSKYCMDMEDSKQPQQIIYKAECVYRVEQSPYYYPAYWDIYGNYTFNYSLNNQPWVYVNEVKNGGRNDSSSK